MPGAAAKLLKDGIPFHDHLGIEVTELAEGYAKTHLELTDELSSRQGTLVAHGGVITALADTTTGLAMSSLHDLPTPTIDIAVEFLNPATCDVYAEASVVEVDGSTGKAEVNIHDIEGTHIAKGHGQFKTRGGDSKSAWLTEDEVDRYQHDDG